MALFSKKQKEIALNEVMDQLSTDSFPQNQNPTKKEIEKEARQISKAVYRLNQVNQKFRFKNRLLKKAASIF